MIALLQKVKSASVEINNKTHSQINVGILLFLGIHKKDTNQDANLGARILGVHLEGPFLSPKHPGAQNAKFIKQPNQN